MPITPLVSLHHTGEKHYQKEKFIAKKEAVEQIVKDFLDIYLAQADQYRATRNIGYF